MSLSAPTVFVVDDEYSMVRYVARVLELDGLRCATFRSARDFLKHYDPVVPGCLVLDVAMPGMSGMELQAELTVRGIELPVIFLTGYGNVPMSVQAMKRGAVDFLSKPVCREDLLRAIRRALEWDHAARVARLEREGIRQRLATLTPREREVMDRVITGKLNKQIAVDLGCAEKTIKIHRSRVMCKMNVQSVAELVRIAAKV